jgi:hypothetical protein
VDGVKRCVKDAIERCEARTARSFVHEDIPIYV